MALTTEQIKGRIKNIAKQKEADARVILRLYMMERFLERMANSKYKDNFIIKGGILVTSMIGINMRSTMDIDTSIKNFTLSISNIQKIICEILAIDLADGVTFKIDDIKNIMDEMEYPGLRILLTGSIGKMIVPFKIDVSTGDIITPKAVEYSYKLLLEDKSINLWSYNLETILAEKLQTILVRGILNTRMRDFYDIHVLTSMFNDTINKETLKNAFIATCKKRNSLLIVENGSIIIPTIMENEDIKKLWITYTKKFSYAKYYDFDSVMHSIQCLFELIEM